MNSKTGFGTKLLAFGCAICPFCAAAKKWPDSFYARTMRAFDKLCPWCKAHKRLHADDTNADNENKARATA